MENKNIITKYVQQKQNLLETYDDLIKYNFVPCKLDNTEITEGSIRGLQSSLEKEEFIMTVCGQIKTGKSTLLNYLLFNGESILPVDDTPHTAKLTAIQYGSENGVKVYFYTKDEWQKLKEEVVVDEETGEKSSYYEEYLKSDIDRSAYKGIYDKEFIREASYCHEERDLKQLGKYVSKDGVYTPFVKQVEVIINNEFIKDVKIVDTPGLNDPNEFRSRITHDWIINSNAVIFLIYSGQPLSRTDLDFIDKHLASISSKKIIFATTKIDIPEDYKRVSDYIDKNLRNNSALKERHLLEGQEVYPISTLAAVIGHKLKNKKPFTEGEKNQYERIQRGIPTIIEKGGHLDDFIKGIEQHLMRDKGNSIIESHKRKIQSICEAKINEVRLKIDGYIDEKKNLELTNQERKEKIDEIKVILDSVETLGNNFKDAIKKIGTEACNKFNVSINNWCVEIWKEIEKWINDPKKTVNYVVTQTIWKVKELIYENVTKRINSILGDKFQKDLNDKLTDYTEKIKSLTKDLFSCYIGFMFNPIISLGDIDRRIEEKITALNSEKLEEHKQSKLMFLTDTKISKENMLNATKKTVDDIAKGINKIPDSVINDEINDYYEKFANNIVDTTRKYYTRLEKWNIEIKDIEKEKGDIEKKMAHLKNFLNDYEKYFEKLCK